MKSHCKVVCFCFGWIYFLTVELNLVKWPAFGFCFVFVFFVLFYIVSRIDSRGTLTIVFLFVVNRVDLAAKKHVFFLLFFSQKNGILCKSDSMDLILFIYIYILRWNIAIYKWALQVLNLDISCNGLLKYYYSHFLNSLYMTLKTYP